MGLHISDKPTDTFTRYLIVDDDGEITVGSVAAMVEMIEMYQDNDVEHVPAVAVLDGNINAEAVLPRCLDDDGTTWTIVTADGGHTVENVEFIPGTWRIKAREVFIDGWATPHPAGDDY